MKAAEFDAAVHLLESSRRPLLYDTDSAWTSTEFAAEIRSLQAALAERTKQVQQRDHDIDVLRTRLVEEHEGNPGVVRERSWESRCHDKETDLYLAIENIKDLRAALSASQAEVAEEKRAHAATSEALKTTVLGYEEYEAENDNLEAQLAALRPAAEAMQKLSEWLAPGNRTLAHCYKSDGGWHVRLYDLGRNATAEYADTLLAAVTAALARAGGAK